MRSCPSVGPSVGWSVGRSVGPCVTSFFRAPKMSCCLYENHWGSPTLILLNVLGVLHVLHVLHGCIVGLLGLVLSLFLQFFFSLHIFPFPTHFFLFFSLFCHLICVQHYLVSDARAFPGRPGRPAKYALDHHQYCYRFIAVLSFFELF